MSPKATQIDKCVEFVRSLAVADLDLHGGDARSALSKLQKDASAIVAFASHAEAMDTIAGCAGVTTLSYEEAIAIYLRERGMLTDGADYLGAPIPSDWMPR